MSSIDLAALKETSLALWHERKPRERIALTWAAIVAVAALLYATALAPVMVGRERLEKSLPTLRQQAAEMQRLAKDAVRFPNSAATPVSTASRDTIEASLRSKGLKAQSIAFEGALARVQLTAISFASLLEWLEEARTSTRLAVVDATIVAQPGGDTVNATLTLQQQKSE